jgi:hypothetical protein
MKTKHALAAGLALWLGWGGGAAAWAGQAGDPQTRARLRERISDLYLLRLTRALDLTEAQTAKLYPLLTRAEKDKAEIQRLLGLDLRKLRDELDRERPKEETLLLLTSGIRQAREDVRRLDVEVEAALDRVLTPLQRARYVIFSVDFLRAVGENLERARAGRGALKRTP